MDKPTCAICYRDNVGMSQRTIYLDQFTDEFTFHKPEGGENVLPHFICVEDEAAWVKFNEVAPAHQVPELYEKLIGKPGEGNPRQHGSEPAAVWSDPTPVLNEVADALKADEALTTEEVITAPPSDEETVG